MLKRVVQAAVKYLKIKHPHAKTRAEQADVLGIPTSTWQELVKDGKPGLTFATVCKIIEAIGGDMSRALPDYDPVKDVAKYAHGDLAGAAAEAVEAKARRREDIIAAGFVSTTGEVQFAHEQTTGLDALVAGAYLFDQTTGPTVALEMVQESGPYLIRTIALCRRPKDGMPIWGGLHGVVRRQDASAWMCEILSSESSDGSRSWLCRPLGLHHTAWSLNPDDLESVVVGTLIDSRLSLLGNPGMVISGTVMPAKPPAQ